MEMNLRLTVCLARVKKRHKCKFVQRLLSMIVVIEMAVYPNFPIARRERFLISNLVPVLTKFNRA